MITQNDFVCCTSELEFCKDIGIIEVLQLFNKHAEVVLLINVLISLVVMFLIVNVLKIKPQFVAKHQEVWTVPNIYLNKNIIF